MDRLPSSLGSEAGQRKRQVLGFSVAGFLALVVDAVAFNLLYLGGLSPSISSFFSLTMAIGFSFVINLFVFSDQPFFRKSGDVFARFAIVALASATYVFFAFEALIFLFPNTGGLWMTLIRVVLFGSATVARFFLYKKWVF